jgi:xanthine dehydrogenase large subunit
MSRMNSQDAQQRSVKPHESAVAHVTGKARYTDEMAMPAGALFLAPVMSASAHARIKSIECAAARTMPGVIEVYTAADIPGRNNIGPIALDEELLPTHTISFYGQAVAYVLAKTQLEAESAAKAIAVNVEPLEAVLSFDDAQRTGSYHSEPKRMLRGDALAALKASEHRLQGRLESGGQDHFYLETHASWAYVDSEDTLRVFSSTQHPSETQHMVAHVLGLTYAQVVVSCLRMGGGFGGKETQANQFAAMVALASFKTRKPVRIKLKREADMSLTGKRHPFRTDYDVGFDAQGRLCGLIATLIADAGWSLDLSPPVLTRAMAHIDNAYFLPAAEIVGLMAKTNKVSNTAFRGFGGPQGMLVIEEIISRIAQYLQLPPAVVRQRNFYRDGCEITPYGQSVRDANGELRMQRVWDELIQLSNFDDRQTALKHWNDSHHEKKRGLAITPVKFGISFNKVQYNQAGAHVLIYVDGTVQINHGGTEMGQGLHSKMLAVASRTLGIDTSRIRVMTTSTEQVPNTSATAASAGADLNGQAIKQACQTLQERISSVLRSAWNLSKDEVLICKDGLWQKADGETLCPFLESIQRSYDARVSLAATGFYATPNLSWDLHTNQGSPFFYFAYGAAACEVEIDCYTGEWRLLKTDIVHDVGDSLNALIDTGQIEGGFAQGMGWLTMEELFWDVNGRLRTIAPSTYKIPTISELPNCLIGDFNVHLLKGASQPGVIYGSKAVGEPPFMLAISVREALRAAISASHTSNSDFVALACPATPEAILRAVAQHQLHQA